MGRREEQKASSGAPRSRVLEKPQDVGEQRVPSGQPAGQRVRKGRWRAARPARGASVPEERRRSVRPGVPPALKLRGAAALHVAVLLSTCFALQSGSSRQDVMPPGVGAAGDP